MDFFVGFLSPLLVMVGWFFVYRNSNRIAKRSETYSLVTKALDKVLDVDRRCVEYWCGSAEKREASEAWISGTLAQIYGIRSLLEILEKYHGFSDKDMVLMRLRMSSTLHAEDISDIGSQLVAERRAKQSEAMSYALHSLYSYYREICD